MGVIIVLLLIFGGVGLYLYLRDQEQKREEAERLANAKTCILCGRTHYNQGNRCTPCCIELFKQQKGRK